MELSSSIIQYAFYVGLGVVAVMGLVNIFHVFRFGLLGPGAIVMVIVYVTATIMLASLAISTAQGHQWTETVKLPFGGSA